MCVDMCVDKCVDMCADMCVDSCADIRADMCVDTYVDMCVGMRVDMCADMCVDMCANMCVDMYVDITSVAFAMAVDMRCRPRLSTQNLPDSLDIPACTIVLAGAEVHNFDVEPRCEAAIVGELQKHLA